MKDVWTHSGHCNTCGKDVYLRMSHMANLVVNTKCSDSFSSCFGDVRYVPWHGDQEQMNKDRTSERLDNLERYRDEIAKIKRSGDWLL